MCVLLKYQSSTLFSINGLSICLHFDVRFFRKKKRKEGRRIIVHIKSPVNASRVIFKACGRFFLSVRTRLVFVRVADNKSSSIIIAREDTRQLVTYIIRIILAVDESVSEKKIPFVILRKLCLKKKKKT